LGEPGAELLGHRQRAALFHLADDVQQVRARDVVDGQVTQHREHVFLEDAGDLLQAGLPSFLQ
jgi:hypothetical protein